MKALCNVHAVLPNGIFPDCAILMDGETIVALRPMSEPLPEGAEVIDGGGAFAGPGFIDIHSHAGGGAWFFDDAATAAAHHRKHGTTSILPALYFNLTQKQWLDAIAHIKAVASGGGAGEIIKGLYMEGPYLNPKFGCEQENNPWAQGIARDQYRPLIEAAGDFAKIWCIAPEREGMSGFIDDVAAALPRCVFSVAHSEATPYQVLDLVPRGLRLATHHTNATGTLEKYPECRGVCVDEAVNFSDDITAELICDSRGIHVDPFMLKLIWKIKGRDRLILVSDCCAFDGPTPPGDYEGVTDLNFDHAGQIAGSKLTLDAACRNMMKHTGVGLCDVFRLASGNPAKLLGQPGLGELKAGNQADIVLVDSMIHVKSVIIGGEKVVLS